MQQPTNKDIKRFWAKVNFSFLGCWAWDSWKNQKGYGLFKVYGRSYKAHRFVYEVCIGEIPDGLVIDHLCRNRGCVNPFHLEPVTVKENTRRGNAGKHGNNHNKQKIACKRGHLFDNENTIITKDGTRRCRKCKNNEQSKARAQKRLQHAGKA